MQCFEKRRHKTLSYDAGKENKQEKKINIQT